MPRGSSGGGPSPQFLQRILAVQPAAFIVVDGDGVVTYGSGRAVMRGVKNAGELVGARLVDFMDEKGRAVLSELMATAAAGGEGETTGPARVTYYDGRAARRSTEAWCVNCTKDPELRGICVLFLPESAYDRFDHVLTRVVAGSSLEQTFGTLAQALRYPPVEAESFVVMPAPDDRSILRAPDLEEVPGPPTKGPWDDVLTGEEAVVHVDVSQLRSELRTSARQAGFSSLSCYGLNRGADGRAKACLVVWSRSAGTPSRSVEMAIERAIALASLSVSHAAADAGMRAAAYRDPLTGLGNRRAFFVALESRVTGGDQPAVLYIDLDGFRKVNDRLGHLAGDAVLRVAARRLASVMRPTDELARLGGDEFAVLCSGGVSSEHLAAIAERILSQLNQPLSVGDGEVVEMGAGVGIASGLPVGTPADTLLAQADRALAQAKLKGKSRYAFSDARQAPVRTAGTIRAVT